MKKFVRRFGIGWWELLLAFLLAGSAEALERMPVERLDLQAQLIREVLKFSSQPLEQITVGIIYVAEAEPIAQEIALEFEKLVYRDHPIRVTLITPDTLVSLPAEVNVVYVTPGNAAFLDAIAELTAARKILSCTGIPEYVQQQKIALGFDSYHEKPQILLCLPVARQANHEFKNSSFLNLQKTRKLVLIK